MRRYGCMWYKKGGTKIIRHILDLQYVSKLTDSWFSPSIGIRIRCEQFISNSQWPITNFSLTERSFIVAVKRPHPPPTPRGLHCFSPHPPKPKVLCIHMYMTCTSPCILWYIPLYLKTIHMYMTCTSPPWVLWLYTCIWHVHPPVSYDYTHVYDMYTPL